jgi:hypothetical protein
MLRLIPKKHLKLFGSDEKESYSYELCSSAVDVGKSIGINETAIGKRK